MSDEECAAREVDLSPAGLAEDGMLHKLLRLFEEEWEKPEVREEYRCWYRQRYGREAPDG